MKPRDLKSFYCKCRHCRVYEGDQLPRLVAIRRAVAEATEA